MARLHFPHVPHSPAASWRWALIGTLAGLVLALVVWAPARWLNVAVSRFSQGQVQLHDARGTIWSGSANVIFRAMPVALAAQCYLGGLAGNCVPACWLSICN